MYDNTSLESGVLISSTSRLLNSDNFRFVYLSLDLPDLHGCCLSL